VRGLDGGKVLRKNWIKKKERERGQVFTIDEKQKDNVRRLQLSLNCVKKVGITSENGLRWEEGTSE